MRFRNHESNHPALLRARHQRLSIMMIEQETAPQYSFRIRFSRSPTDTIKFDGDEIKLSDVGSGESVYLRSSPREVLIKNAEQLVLIGDGYQSEDEAHEAGTRYMRILTVALAKVRVGAEFGARVGKSVVTYEGVKWLEAQQGQRILNDVHGLMVYLSRPTPKFARFSVKGIRGASVQSFQTIFASARRASGALSDREKLAFTLFNASFFLPTADMRFILLVMAIEALIEPEPRSAAAQEHVKQLISETKKAALPDAERSSMLGSLRWLLSESIAQGGCRLVTSRLGDREYEQKPAAQYFTQVYQMRSNLVHGNLPYPTFEEVSTAVANLEVFVSDLLTKPYIEAPK